MVGVGLCKLWLDDKYYMTFICLFCYDVLILRAHFIDLNDCYIELSALHILIAEKLKIILKKRIINRVKYSFFLNHKEMQNIFNISVLIWSLTRT